MKQILNNTWRILHRDEKKRFSLLILFDILISLLDILSLVILLLIVQFYIQGNSTKLPFLQNLLTGRNPVFVIVFFLIFFAIKNLLAFSITRMQYKFIADVSVRISAKNLSRFQHADFNEFIQTDSSVHIRRIGFQPLEFCQHVLSGIQQIITQCFLIFLSVLAIVIFNARVFLLLLAVLLPPVVIVFYLIKRKLSALKLEMQSSNEKTFRSLYDALKGYVESNIYNSHEFFMNRFVRHRTLFSKKLFSSIGIQALPSRIIETFAVLGLLILMLIAQWNGNGSSSTFITIAAFLAAAYKIIPGVVKVINTSGQMRAFESSLDEIANDRTEIPKNLSGTAIQISSIEFRDVSFQYGSAEILKNFHLCISKGQMLGITGKSGIGKTTILNLLLGFVAPKQGTIRINGHDSDAKALQSYWSAISYVRQQSFLMHESILQNITLSETEPDKKRLEAALKISGLEEILKDIPEGLHKMITENGKNISGGQQQRIAIARALYKDADLYLLDEPFNELDDASSKTLLKHFVELVQKGKTVIIITHDQSSLSFCNKIVSLDPS